MYFKIYSQISQSKIWVELVLILRRFLRVVPVDKLVDNFVFVRCVDATFQDCATQNVYRLVIGLRIDRVGGCVLATVGE